MSLRIWENLPEKYRASNDPEAPVLLYRGDQILGKYGTGMHCSLESSIDPEDLVFQSLFVKYPNIRTLVKRHTQNNHNSPFISLTDQLELAQKFATEPNETVYQILLPAHCLVVDTPNSAETRNVEVLAIGSVKLDDIVAVMASDPSLEVAWDKSQSWIQ